MSDIFMIYCTICTDYTIIHQYGDIINISPFDNVINNIDYMTDNTKTVTIGSVTLTYIVLDEICYMCVTKNIDINDISLFLRKLYEMKNNGTLSVISFYDTIDDFDRLGKNKKIAKLIDK